MQGYVSTNLLFFFALDLHEKVMHEKVKVTIWLTNTAF